MFFQFSPVRSTSKTETVLKPKNESEETEILSLAPFTPLPKVFFENIKIGEVACRKLLIKNAAIQDINLHVNLNNIPKEFSVSVNWETKYFEKGKEEIFEIYWCPSSIVSNRYVITFEDFKKIRRDVPVIFKTEVPVIKKKGSKIEKQKTALSKPITKKYSAKSSKISPIKIRKAIPSIKKYSPPKFLQQPYSDRHFFMGNKENIPSTLDETSTSTTFVSPRKSSFQMNTFKHEDRRETYIFNNEIQTPSIILNTLERRETYVLPGKAVEETPSYFNDSLEMSTPIVSPTNCKKNLMTHSMSTLPNRTPLRTPNSVNLKNIPSNSIRNPAMSDFEYKMMRLQSFCFSPLEPSNIASNTSSIELDKKVLNGNSNIHLVIQNNTFDINSTTNVNSLNVSTETYVKTDISGETYVKDNSFETYIKGNLSNETYTKDNSSNEIQFLKVSPTPSNISASPRSFLQSDSGRFQETFEYQNEIPKKQLSCIIEESFMSHTFRESTPKLNVFKKPLHKRKSDIDYIFSPPKKANITSPIKDWSKKGGNAIRIAKRTSGISVTDLKKKNNNEISNEALVELAKTDTNNIIIQNPFLLAATNSIDPFIARHLAVSEEWIEKQENHFKNWLNALLTPPKDLASDEQSVNVAKIWQQSKNTEVEVAPSKEIICNKYHTSNRLNSLRKSAREFYQTKDFCLVLANVYNAVDQGKLSIREDRDIRSNLALRSEITALLLSYNPLWLRIGLETMYNEIIPLTSNSDVIGLSHFICNRILKDPYLLKKHKSVHSPNYVKDFNKFFLKKYFTLVYFLDKAKNTKLISHDPCLFCKKGAVKESKELLLRLARETLSAIGDITKYLKYLGYIVTHVQTYIHEFDYGVKKLGVDLRDGVRLTKIMEIILMKNNLTCALRVPAISRLQKVHNMKIVFDELEKAGYKIMYDISPKDIVDGHREKTLSFLWQIIYKFETPFITKSATTIQTWFRSLPIVLKRRILERKRLEKQSAANKIRNWYLRHKLAERLIFFAKSLKYYMDFTKRERATIMIQKNFRMYICRKRYIQQKHLITKIQSRCRGWLMRNVNSHKIRSTVTIQSYVRMFIHRRRYSKMKGAVILFQRQYRAMKAMKLARAHYLELKMSVVYLQRKYRANRLSLKEKQAYQDLKIAAVNLQQKYRGNKLYRLQREQYLTLKRSTVLIQCWYRAKKARRSFLLLKQSVRVFEKYYLGLKCMRNERNAYCRLRSATVILQRRYRALIEMRIQRNYYCELKNCAIFIQQKYRAKKQMELASIQYQRLRITTVLIQRKFKAKLKMQSERQIFNEKKSAVINIQSWFRASREMKKSREYYLSLKYAVQIIEHKYEALCLMKRNRENFQRKKSASITIQRRFRALLCMRFYRKEYLELKSSCILIQNIFRANRSSKIQRAEFLKLRSSTVVLQRRFRARLEMLKCCQHFQRLKLATVLVQTKFRAKLLMRAHRFSYEHLRKCTINIQRRYRAQKSMLKIKSKFVNLKRAAVIIQQKWRAKKLYMSQRRNFIILKYRTVFIQQHWRANKLAQQERNNYERLKKTTVFVQTRWRANKLRNHDFNYYNNLRQSAIFLQQKWRAKRVAEIDKKYYENLRKSAIYIQQKWRANYLAKLEKYRYEILKKNVILIQRRWRANKLRNQEFNYFNNLRDSAILVQQKWRAKKVSEMHKKYYQNLRNSAVYVQQKWRGNNLAKLEKYRYEILKKNVIFIQMRWRANKLRNQEFNYFNNLRHSAILVQQKWRAKKIGDAQKRYYNKLKKVVIYSQQKWRANKLTRQDRKNYCEVKIAAIIIQRHWRAKKMRTAAQNYYIKLRNMTIKMQQLWRANKSCQSQRKRYQDLKHAAVIIERRWMAKKIGNYQKSYYVKLKHTTLVIQRKWRANKIRDQTLTAYKMLKKAVITIQQRWRANKLCNEQKCYYQSFRRTVIMIQRKWRANKLMQKHRLEYIRMRQSIIYMQSKWRNVRVERYYLHLRQVVITIQQKWRARRLMMIEAKKFAILKHYTIIIQKKFRANILMKKQRSSYLNLRKSVLIIQKFYRGYKTMRKLQSEFTIVRKTVLKLQTFIRGYLIRRKYEQFLSLEAREERKIARKQKLAAIKIQALWKGYRCRKTLIPDCEKIYQRLKKVNETVDPEKTLESRATVALQVFTCERPTLFAIIKALEELVYITRHSKEICKRMRNILPDQLYALLSSTSRSLPETNACIFSINILITFYKQPSTKVYSFVPEYIDKLITMMLHCCDKESLLFAHTCTLLWLFAHESKWRDFIRSLPNLEQRFDKIRTLVLRKQNMVKKAGVKGSSMFSAYKDLPLPNLKPDGGLVANKTGPNTFSNSVQAMLELSKILGI